MLAPFSDVDVLFLMPDKSPPGMEKVVEALLYVLWDLKLKVGHATRTIDECLKQARADMTIRTTIVEARFISGDKALFEKLRVRFDKEIVAKTAAEFVAAKLAERETRVRKAGASRYLVEPNVKEGKGGLRDLNTLFWISKYVYRVHNPTSWSPQVCSLRASSRSFADARNSSGACAAGSTFLPAGPRSG